MDVKNQVLKFVYYCRYQEVIQNQIPITEDINISSDYQLKQLKNNEQIYSQIKNKNIINQIAKYKMIDYTKFDQKNNSEDQYGQDFQPMQEILVKSKKFDRNKQMEGQQDKQQTQLGYQKHQKLNELKIQEDQSKGKPLWFKLMEDSNQNNTKDRQQQDQGQKNQFIENNETQKNVQKRKQAQNLNKIGSIKKGQFNSLNETTTKAKLQEDRQSKIKQTITKLTKNIIVTKQSIVDQITSINQYYQQNQGKKQKQDNLQYKNGIKYKLINKQKKIDVEWQNQKLMKYKMLEKIKKNMEQQQKAKEEQRRRKRQIFERQKQAKRQQQRIQKNQSRIKKDEVQKRIIYEQKFISRRSGSPEIQITQDEIKAFQNAFIQHIKQRLNIGKVKNKPKSLQKSPQLNKNKKIKQQRRRSYNKRLNKDEKLKQKILINLKQKIQKQLEPTYQSILTNSQQLENPPTPIQDQNRNQRAHQSAPQLRLPNISLVKPQRRTFYSKDNINLKPQKIHILKLSDGPDQ